MGTNNSGIALAGTELAATMTGSTVLIGTLPQQPVMIIFDNQSTVAVQIFVNQTTSIWRTFPSGEALILDMRANLGLAPNFTFPVGTTFYGNGASGTFSISYIYAQNM
jgi:hypothetical protein